MPRESDLIAVDEHIARVSHLELGRRVNPAVELLDEHLGAGFVRTKIGFLEDYRFAHNAPQFVQTFDAALAFRLLRPTNAVIRYFCARATWETYPGAPQTVLGISIGSSASDTQDLAAPVSPSIITAGDTRDQFRTYDEFSNGVVEITSVYLGLSVIPFGPLERATIIKGSCISFVWQQLT